MFKYYRLVSRLSSTILNMFNIQFIRKTTQGEEKVKLPDRQTVVVCEW